MLKDLHVNIEDIKDISPRRALLFMQVYQRNAEKSRLARIMLNFYKEFSRAKISLHIGKGHTILTASPDKELMLFDFIRYEKKIPEGYVVANNDTLQIIDPTKLPHDDANVSIILNNTLNDLFILGAYEKLEVHPVYDSPHEEVTELLREKMIAYAKKLNVRVYDHGSLGTRSLMMGASAFGRLYKKPPTFYNKLKPGMKILIHRPLGELALINSYLTALFSDIVASMANQLLGVDIDKLYKAKELALEVMKIPNIKIAKIINKFLPEMDEKFRPEEHIAVTVDLSGPGILVFKEIANLAKVNITLYKVPLLDEEIVHFVVRNYLVPNGTAGTNGAVGIIASEDVMEELFTELKREGYNPAIIGEVQGVGTGILRVTQNVASLIAQPSLLNELEIIR